MSSIFVFILSHPLEFIFHFYPQEMQYAYIKLILKLKTVHSRLHFQMCNLLAILYPCWVASLCWHLSVFSVADGKCSWLIFPYLQWHVHTVIAKSHIARFSQFWVACMVSAMTSYHLL